jgi:hypothetical protein
VHGGVPVNSITDVTASTWLAGARRGAAQLDHRCTREYTVHWCMVGVSVKSIIDVLAITRLAGAWPGCRRSPMYSRVHRFLVQGGRLAKSLKRVLLVIALQMYEELMKK